MRKVILLVAVTAMGFAPAPLPKKAARAPEPRLCGEWEIHTWTFRGSDGTTFAHEAGVVRIVPGYLEIRFESGDRLRWSMTLASASSPRMDLRDADTGRLRLAISKLEGDTLTICHDGPGESRPQEFHDSTQWMLVLKRKQL